jgi:hypothetical protein
VQFVDSIFTRLQGSKDDFGPRKEKNQKMILNYCFIRVYTQFSFLSKKNPKDQRVGIKSFFKLFGERKFFFQCNLLN